jgi:hypothetical protein
MPVPPPSTARALMASTGAALLVRRTAPPGLGASSKERTPMNWLKRILCGLGFTKKSGCPMEWSSASGAAFLVFDEDDDFYRGS